MKYAGICITFLVAVVLLAYRVHPEAFYSLLNRTNTNASMSANPGYSGEQGNPGCTFDKTIYQGCAKVTIRQYVVEGAEPTATVNVQWNVDYENLRTAQIDVGIINSTGVVTIYPLEAPMYQSDIAYDPGYNVTASLSIAGFSCQPRNNEVWDCKLAALTTP